MARDFQRQRSRSGLWVVALSLLMHAAVLVSLPSPSAPRSLAPPASYIELESVASPAPIADAPEEAAAESPPVATAEKRLAIVTQPASHPPIAPLAEPSAPVEFTPEPAVANREEPPPAAVDLSPRAAALSVLPPASPEPAARSAGELAQDRSAELTAHLRAAARADVERLSKPRALELKREPDGTCHYQGTAIDATILPDGGVLFSDKGLEPQIKWGVDTPPERPATPDDTVAPQRLELGLRVVPRATEAERAWFMRESEPIRRELADAARARELREAERTLRAQIDRIWCDESLSKPQRRRAIFEVWADTRRDDVGARGRGVIIDYVRRNLPAGSSDAYTARELTELAMLAKPYRFAPYEDTPPDGGDATP